MKKTLIALLALAGVAAADVTIGSYGTKDGVDYDIVETFSELTNSEVKAQYGIALDKLHFSTLSFTLDTANMLVSDSTLNVGDTLTLKSLTILGRHDQSGYSANDSTMTLSLGNTQYTSSAAEHVRKDGKVATITYNFTNPITFELGEELKFTFNRAGTSGDGKDQTYNLGIAPMQGVTGAPIVFGGVWQMAAQLSVTIPEPTTATLSLLALAGLAARRRRR